MSDEEMIPDVGTVEITKEQPEVDLSLSQLKGLGAVSEKKT